MRGRGASKVTAVLAVLLGLVVPRAAPAHNEPPVVDDSGAIPRLLAPPAPAITSPADGAYVSVHDLPVSGTAPPNTTVLVQTDGPGEAPPTTAGPDGRWSVVLAGLEDGTYMVVAYAEDEGGLSDASPGVTVHVDTSAPAAPAIADPGAAPTGSTATLSGTAEAGSVVVVYDDGREVGRTQAQDGTWSLTLPAGPGEHHYTAVAIDRAGNASPASAPRTVTVTAPAQATPTPAPTGTLPPGATSTPSRTTAPLPPPVVGKAVNVQRRSGRVLVKVPGSNRFVELDVREHVPVGTTIDTTNGRVTLTSASNPHGGTQKADFYGGVFKVGQTKGAKPITELTLAGAKPSCGRSAKASARAAAKRKARRLWGDGSGAFRTHGQYSAATVRGTTWLTEDRCGGTLTRVKRGVVAVRDFAKRRTVLLRAGRSYLARARRR